MMNFIAPIIVVLIGIATFFGFIDPRYENIKKTSAEIEQYNRALDRSKELTAVRDQLLIRYNSFSQTDLERLRKLLPDNVDNVRLIMDIDSIASQYGLVLRNVSIGGEATPAESSVSRPGVVQSINLGFVVTSPYENFMRFLDDLERSLRVVDVVSLSFDTSDIDLYEFGVNLRTYWLR